MKLAKRGWPLFFLSAIASYLYGIGALPFVGPDEPRYAEVAREMLMRADLVTPTLGGHTWFEKPALLYWLEMVSYKAFGVTEFAARLGPALFGLGTVVALWVLGRALTTKSTDCTDKNAASAFVPFVANDLSEWLAVVAASTLGILAFSHGASFDIIITFPLTAALTSFYIFEHSSIRKAKVFSLPLVLFYVFIGVSLLAKGLIGIIFPFAIVAFYYVLARKLPNRTFVISLLWGTALAVAIAAVWYVPVYLQNGWPFVDEFFIQHHFQRFLSNKYQHPQPFYFFLWVLPLMTLPWLPLFIAAVIKAVRTRVKTTASEPLPYSPTPLLLYCVSWIAVPLVFFSLSGSKLPGYILPAVPSAVIITSLYLTSLPARSRSWRTIALSIAGLTLAGTIVLAVTAVPRFANGESIRPLMDAADTRGLTNDRVFGLHDVPQGAEFYAAGRLLRDTDGKQKKLYSVAEVKTEMERAGVARSLVIVPLNVRDELATSKLVRSEFIADNGELAIYSVSLN
jgi:4-amino-4-deoxy-L-arabinose transferase-like glycosyltransferase